VTETNIAGMAKDSANNPGFVAVIDMENRPICRLKAAANLAGISLIF
jgi:hypothetical protein